MGKMSMVVIWPAFLAACILEALVFALVDPLELTWGHGPLGWSRQAVYTLAFFVFWAVVALAALLALWLARGAAPAAGPGEGLRRGGFEPREAARH
jgi:hypothetical protein